MKQTLIALVLSVVANVILKLVYPDIPSWALAIYGATFFGFVSVFFDLQEIKEKIG